MLEIINVTYCVMFPSSLSISMKGSLIIIDNLYFDELILGAWYFLIISSWGGGIFCLNL